MTVRRTSSHHCLPALVATAWLAAPGPAVADLVLGEPSILSQRGQRLQLVLPYGSAPGERVSVSRFEVVSVRTPDGFTAPAAEAFTIAKPAHRNLVYLRSAEPVDATEVTVALRVNGQDGDPQVWRIVLPAASWAPVEATPLAATAAPSARRPPRAANAAPR